eukprot:CAMPEP_0167767194 /NCGR_PEP_ID=MMETSP0110_2-20121227/15882_1 /TAXON_ID=629695 /ORGANISM="Gymnochlora sp., Strain CCMP2014" /LENGTH=37 /DNA_ID= /DNA_START= /DNA_END= /DNA_ORIENTATION=
MKSNRSAIAVNFVDRDPSTSRIGSNNRVSINRMANST